MTTIAYRDGVMASDSGAWSGNSSHGWARKLVKGADGTLYGVTGHAAECSSYLAWVDGGCEGAEPKPRETKDEGNSFMVLRVTPRGRIEFIGAYGAEVYDAPYYAVGAGAEVAFGALYMGATAAEAIEAAREHGSGAFGAVQTISK